MMEPSRTSNCARHQIPIDRAHFALGSYAISSPLYFMRYDRSVRCARSMVEALYVLINLSRQAPISYLRQTNAAMQCVTLRCQQEIGTAIQRDLVLVVASCNNQKGGTTCVSCSQRLLVTQKKVLAQRVRQQYQSENGTAKNGRN